MTRFCVQMRLSPVCVVLAMALLADASLVRGEPAASPKRGVDLGAAQDENPALRAEGYLHAGLEQRGFGHEDAAKAWILQAVNAAPDFAPARWQNGEVRFQGNWIAISEVANATARDAVLSRYFQMRDDLGRRAQELVLFSTRESNPLDSPFCRAPAAVPRMLRKSFEIQAEPELAKLAIRTQGKAAVWINGMQLVFSGHRDDWRSQSITRLLRRGKNVIAISVDSVDGASVPVLEVLAEGILKDHGLFNVASDDQWKVCAGCDERWTEPEFEDAAWDQAIAHPTVDGATGEAERHLVAGLELSLAKWCNANGLPDQAKCHFANRLELGAKSAEDLKSLGILRKGTQLIAAADVAGGVHAAPQPSSGSGSVSTDISNDASREKTDSVRSWTTLVQHLRREYESGDPLRVQQATAQLQQVDSSAIPAFEPLARKKQARSELPVAFVEHVLGRLTDIQSTQALTRLAIYSPQEPVRAAAIEQLSVRDLSQFVPSLLVKLQPPLLVETHYSKRSDKGVVEFTCRAVYTRRFVMMEDVQVNTYRVMGIRMSSSQSNQLGLSHLPGTSEVESDLRAREANLYRMANETNAQIDLANAPALHVLSQIAGKEHVSDYATAWNWWFSYNDVQSPNTYEDAKSKTPATQPRRRVRESSSQTFIPMRSTSCFARGTPVWTLRGLCAIETVKVGDMVLSQDVETGELAYKTVLTTTIRPPTSTLSLKIGSETIVTTPGHRFWEYGSGWRMAKELNVRDQLHTLAGSAELSHVASSGNQQVFNLVVDGFHSYFVGQAKILVHDVEAPLPYTRVVPGLAAK